MPVPTESTENSSCVMSSNTNVDCTSEITTDNEHECYHRNTTPNASVYYENVVLVQVNPGETFTIQREDGSCRNISGPAEVPMVSHNGAIPPIYVPPGYMSQVIEENGVRRVIVLPSPAMDGQLSYMGMPTMHHPHAQMPMHGMQQTHIIPGMYPQTMMPNCRPEEVVPYFHHPMFVSEEMYFSDLSDSSFSPMHQNMQGMTPPSDIPNNVSPQPHPYPPGQHESLPKTLQDDQVSSQQLSSESTFSASSMTSSPASTSSFASSPSGSPKAFRNSVHSHSYNPSKSPVNHELSSTPPLPVPSNVNTLNPNSHCYQMQHPSTETLTSHSSAAYEDKWSADVGRPKTDTRCYQTVAELLMAVRKPEVRDLKDRSAKLVWAAVPVQNVSQELKKSLGDFNVMFELHFSRSRKDNGKFRCIYSGKDSKYTFRDLRPSSDYIVKLYATCNCERSQPTEATTFRTLSSVPDAPTPPKLQSRTKNSLQLKWTAPYDNGERIHKYHLEIDEAKHGNGFRPLFSVSQKQVKVPKLVPAHAYLFRLAAENKLGKSAWSPVARYETSGLVPPVPDSPRLSKATSKSLALAWAKTGEDTVEYTLEMEDESNGYGFHPVYRGEELKHVVKNLARATSYKFRLVACNSEGKSKHSEIVSFPTRPDKPRPPVKLQVKGNVHARSFKLCWDAPTDSGGAVVNEYIVEMAQDQGFAMQPIYSGPDKECQADHLEPGRTYRLRALCRTNAGTSLPSDVLTVNTLPSSPGQCSPPMLAMCPKPTRLIIKWDPPRSSGGATTDEYELNYLLSAETGSIQPSQAYKGPDLECAVDKLLPGTEYSFAVRAANAIGFGPWSDRLEAVTSPDVPEKPITPEATVLSPTLIHLQWNRPGCNGAEIVNYRIQWNDAEGATSIEETGPVLVHEMKRLEPDTTYTYSITAVNRVGPSPSSDVGCVTTPPSCPSPVENLRHCDVSDVVTIPFTTTASRIAVQWDKPKDNGSEITGYKIHVSQTHSSSGNSSLYEIDGSLTHYCIADLESDTAYSIKVCAANDIGCGCFSSPFKVRTKSLPPDAPELTCVQMTSSSLKLKWKNRSKFTEGIHYLLQRRDKHGRFVTQYKGSDHSYKVSKLSENTAYQFRINASNSEGLGHFSQEYSFSTPPQLPPMLEAPAISEVQATSCHVTWLKMDAIKGDPVRFRLSLGKPNDPEFNIVYPCNSNNYILDQLLPNTTYNIRITALRRCSSSVRCSPPSRDDSSLCSEVTDDGQDVDLPGPPGHCTHFRTLPSDQAFDATEKPRLFLRCDPPATSKQSEVLEHVSLQNESCVSPANISESSENKVVAMVLILYLLSAIVIASILQSIFVASV